MSTQLSFLESLNYLEWSDYDFAPLHHSGKGNYRDARNYFLGKSESAMHRENRLFRARVQFVAREHANGCGTFKTLTMRATSRWPMTARAIS